MPTARWALGEDEHGDARASGVLPPPRPPLHPVQDVTPALSACEHGGGKRLHHRHVLGSGIRSKTSGANPPTITSAHGLSGESLDTRVLINAGNHPNGSEWRTSTDSNVFGDLCSTTQAFVMKRVNPTRFVLQLPGSTLLPWKG